ncbi:MAG TPA: citrate/2-methylcitrate synthase, partial [Lapillicoccus sp.]|nr:citrate/2-methylcitrate synthase [Lapillicoccus sp.]
VEELLLLVSSRFGLSPNVDLGLAALVHACGLRTGSGETVFALARMVGMLAHAIEEYPQAPAVPAARRLHRRRPLSPGRGEAHELSGTPAAGPVAEAADPHTGHWAG